MAVILLCSIAGACGGEDPDLSGTPVEVLAVWQGAEAQAFRTVLDAFERQTGAVVRFTSTEGEDIARVLDARLVGDDPPDVAVLPQPGLIARYAEERSILPIDDIVGAAVRTRYAPVWQRLGTHDGALYGVWFKAANKSLVWYSIAAFERAAVVPPSNLAGLRRVADAMAAEGMPAFALPGDPSEAWTLTDWFENLYLRVAGPDRYDDLAAHRLPWTDDSVEETLSLLASFLGTDGPRAIASGSTFSEAVATVFSTAPAASMIVEGDFVPGVVAGTSEAEIGVDVDAFSFPEQQTGDRFVVGGGDAAVLMRPSDGGRELVRFLATPAAAELWAGIGGFVSPNESVDLAVYPDALSRRIARAVLEAGDSFRFDLSDLQPVKFGGTTGTGMWAALRDFLAAPTDVAGTARRLEAEAARAWADHPGATAG